MLKQNIMKALQIINKSSVEVEKMYWTPNQYDVTIKNSNGVHVFGVKLTLEGTFELFNYQFSEANQSLVDSIKSFISFEIVEVESCNEMQIPFPTQKSNNYHETELGKVPDSVKNVEFKGTVIDASDGKEKRIADILSGKHDDDFVDPEKFPIIAKTKAYNDATNMLNWAELSRMLAGDRSSIQKERIPEKHRQKIYELRLSIAEWLLTLRP
jgi:hypothetical protein